MRTDKFAQNVYLFQCFPEIKEIMTWKKEFESSRWKELDWEAKGIGHPARAEIVE